MRMGVSLGLAGRGRQVFSPRQLFATGSGAWFEANPSRMFQDDAGASPVTATAQTVGRINDISGGGRNATQATAGARPTYGVVPVGGRRNILTYSEQFENAAWTKTASGTGTAPAVTQNAGAAPNGTLTADQIVFSTGAGTAGTDFSLLAQAVTTTAASHTASIWLRTLSGTATLVFRGAANASFTTITVTSEWQRFSRTETAIASINDKITLGIRQGLGGIGTINGSATILAWGGQLELGSSASANQRVVTAFDVSEAGVASVPYLSDDGGDSISWTAPAGTYTVARVNSAGTVTIQTGQALSGATDMLLDTQTTAYVAVNRALSSYETTSLRAYLRARAGK